MNPQRPREWSGSSPDKAASAIDSSAAPETIATYALRRYALHEEIAAGRVATVHLGRLQGPEGFARTVAVKRVRSQFVKDAELAAMLLDGARLAGRVRHPNVVATLDVVAGDELLVVMEYVHGESLGALLRTLRGRGSLAPLPVVSGILAGMLRGLHAVHEARGTDPGVDDGDPSPPGVLVGTDGVPRLFDLGVGQAGARASNTRAADVFAASTLLWEALAGRPLLPRVAPEGLEPPSRYRADLPPAIDAIVTRGLSRAPADRFATAAQMADALEAEVRTAPPFEIGAWVTSLAMSSLDERTRILARLEGTAAVASAAPAPEAAPASPEAALAPEAAPAVQAALPAPEPVRDAAVAPPSPLLDPKEAVTRRTRSIPPPAPSFDTKRGLGPVTERRPRPSVPSQPPLDALPRVRGRATVLAAVGAAVVMLVVGLRYATGNHGPEATPVEIASPPHEVVVPAVESATPVVEAPEAPEPRSPAPPPARTAAPVATAPAPTPPAAAAPSRPAKASRPRPPSATTRNDVL